jgi:hypothetical protein
MATSVPQRRGEKHRPIQEGQAMLPSWRRKGVIHWRTAIGDVRGKQQVEKDERMVNGEWCIETSMLPS